MIADRTSPAWQRIRSGCELGAWYVDLDAHADRIWLLIVSRALNSNGRCGSSAKTSAAAARR